MRLDGRFPALPRLSRALGPLLLLSGGVAAAAPGPQSTLPPAVEQARRLGTRVDPALIAADNQLGTSLLNSLRAAQPNANLFISPLSLALALDMASDGAFGATRQAMVTALGLGGLAEPDPIDNAALLADLLPQDPGARLWLANGLWTQAGVTLPAFQNLDRTYYGAYLGDLAGGAAAVNAWVLQETQGQVPAMLSTDARCQDYDVLLANAAAFQGTWECPFDPASTVPGPFHRQDGSQVVCPMMTRTGLMEYTQPPGMQIARLPFGSRRFGMFIVLPVPGAPLEDVTAQVPGLVRSLERGLASSQVQITLPRFHFAATVQLQAPLTALGMGVAFDPAQADFSAMTPAPHVLFGVVHRARLAVDETGTLAAAGSAVPIGAAAVTGQPVPMVVDRPFMLAITDRETSAMLFLGLVMDPTAD